MVKFISFNEWLKNKILTEAPGGPYDPKMTPARLHAGGAGGFWGNPKASAKIGRAGMKKK